MFARHLQFTPQVGLGVFFPLNVSFLLIYTLDFGNSFVVSFQQLIFPNLGLIIAVQCHQRKASYEKYSIDKIDVCGCDDKVVKWIVASVIVYAFFTKWEGKVSEEITDVDASPITCADSSKIPYSSAEACVSESSWLLCSHHRNPIR